MSIINKIPKVPSVKEITSMQAAQKLKTQAQSKLTTLVKQNPKVQKMLTTSIGYGELASVTAKGAQASFMNATAGFMRSLGLPANITEKGISLATKYIGAVEINNPLTLLESLVL